MLLEHDMMLFISLRQAGNPISTVAVDMMHAALFLLLPRIGGSLCTDRSSVRNAFVRRALSTNESTVLLVVQAHA